MNHGQIHRFRADVRQSALLFTFRVPMSTADPSKPWHVLRRSSIHGTGVYAARKIPAGTQVFEYIGEIISAQEADRRHPVNPDDPFHTFFFALSNGKVIDGGPSGNDAKWINHSCEPNCETEETDDHRIHIVALRDIKRGEELYYDYGLVLDERLTKKVREQYQCLCGTPSCRGTMLALKRKPAAKKAAKKAVNKAVNKAAKKAAKAAGKTETLRVKSTKQTKTPAPRKKMSGKVAGKTAKTPPADATGKAAKQPSTKTRKRAVAG